MPKEKEEVIIEKASTVAFLSLKKCHVTPFVKPNGRVAFRVRGNVSKILSELQANPLVNLLDYIQRLDSTRSIIFLMKESDNPFKKE